MSNSFMFEANKEPTLDQLLDTLGFSAWKTIYASFIMPSASLIGVILCLLSGWIFSQKKFKDPVFFYYRLLCLVYVIHLIHNLPLFLVYSPRYFPHLNTYLTSIYLIYYLNISVFLFHYEETLQMAILLTRMKIYNSFVNKHFSTRPWLISFCFFLTCLFIDIFSVFVIKVKSLGTYYYYDDSSNELKQTAEFYYFGPSDFSFSLVGKILILLSGPVLNIFLSIVVGITLNIVSVKLYRSYVRERRQKEEVYTSIAFNHDQEKAIDALNEDEIEEMNVMPMIKLVRIQLTQKELNENRAEKNMFKMALTLCSCSILFRVLLILVYIYFVFFTSSFSDNLVLVLVANSIYSFGPTVAICIFYSFNKMFRAEFKKKFFRKKNSTFD